MKKKKPNLSRSEIMSRVRAKDTKAELLLRKVLWAKGYRYRKNYTKVFGKPDIVFLRKKIAIFCDSEFWHGKYYMEGKRIPKSNKQYWIDKFERNIARDQLVNQRLLEDGWVVLRFWETDILSDVNKCVDEIEKILLQNRKCSR